MLSKSRFGLLAVAGLIALIIPLALFETEVYGATPTPGVRRQRSRRPGSAGRALQRHQRG